MKPTGTTSWEMHRESCCKHRSGLCLFQLLGYLVTALHSPFYECMKVSTCLHSRLNITYSLLVIAFYTGLIQKTRKQEANLRPIQIFAVWNTWREIAPSELQPYFRPWFKILMYFSLPIYALLWFYLTPTLQKSSRKMYSCSHFSVCSS